MIVLLALGDRGYGYWAYNIALSIRTYSPELPIQLINNGVSIKNIDTSVFDVLTRIKDEHCTTDGKLNPSLAKVNLYEYLVDDENIYLDVDGIVIKPLESLFMKCKGFNWASQMVGTEQKDMMWAKHSDMIEHFNLGDVPIMGINSSFQFIRQCQETYEFFECAKEQYANPFPINKMPIKWGQGQPDELYFVVAMIKTGIKCDIGEQVVYFRTRNAGGEIETLEKLRENHYVIGCWGDRGMNHKSVENYYDKLTKKHSTEIKGTNQIVKFAGLIRQKFVTQTS